MQDNVNKFVDQLETFKNRKKPDVCNARKSIANVEKGKYGNLRCLKAARGILRVGNTIICYLKGIKLYYVQTKLPTWAKTSLIEGGGEQGCRHNSFINSASQKLIITTGKKSRTKFVRGTSSIGKIGLFNTTL